MITLIIAEASLELVPEEIAWHSAVRAHSRRQGKEPKSILLDRSYHHQAMLNLRDAHKRGRPDIAHFSLLEATSIPLYYNNMLRIYVHTMADKVISIGRDVRLPKNYNRFIGLMEDLFTKGKIESDESKHTLLEIEDMGFNTLIDRVRPSKVIGLSRSGEMRSAEYVASIVKDVVGVGISGVGDVGGGACIVVGGFPKGTFSPAIRSRLDHTIAISRYSLEAHVVVARVLYEVEKALLSVC
ncbi:MAG: ribosome biogenesis protein [Candidatus Nitrosocaldus sp.]